MTMNTIPTFTEFGKISRLSRDIVITEKLDGTNSQILIADDQEPFIDEKRGELPFLCGSRNRWIFPGDDNYGFATWAYKNAKELMGLGPGRHFGEWWGAGIQRNYGLKEKRFSLFNTGRWAEVGQSIREGQSTAPSCCRVVPVMYSGQFSESAINECLEVLRAFGSVAEPGFLNPEGVVIFHTASNQMFKKTILKDEIPKSLSNS